MTGQGLLYDPQTYTEEYGQLRTQRSAFRLVLKVRICFRCSAVWGGWGNGHNTFKVELRARARLV